MLSSFLTWAAIGTNSVMFAASVAAFLFIILIALFLIKAFLKVDLSRMFYETGATEVSSTKVWHAVAYFMATIAFIFINITTPGSTSLEFIWLTYLGAISGSAGVSKLINAKYNNGSDNDSVPSAPTPRKAAKGDKPSTS